MGTPFWSLAGGFNYHWRNVLSGDLNLSVQGAYSGAGRCNAESQAQGSCLSIPAFEIGTPFTNITAPRFYGVELGIRY